MKSFTLGLALVVVSFVTVSVAKADFIAGRVRTTQVANGLDQVDSDGRIIETEVADFSAQSMDGKRDFVSFTLTVKVQPQCFTTPCPSYRDTRNYRVIRVRHESELTTSYTALEVPSNPAAAAFVGRKMEVTEDNGTREISITDRVIQNKNIVQMYKGGFEDLMVTQ